ncbi:MAG: peptidoglycan-binding domain-containing protein [bacterium]|nr:peptidoglycan-binding domain-containing protein [bacterium]
MRIRNFIVALSILAGTTLMPALASADCVNLKSGSDLSEGMQDATLNSPSGRVYQLQALLQSTSTTPTSAKYLILPSGTLPGYFGGMTKTALTQFQTDRGLTANGIADSATRDKIYALTGCTASNDSGGGGSSAQTFVAVPASGVAPLQTHFSFDAKGPQMGNWIDFGDEQASIIYRCLTTTCAGVTVAHTYASSGTYSARLLVSPACIQGVCSSDYSVANTTSVTVNASSASTPSTPTATLTFNGLASQQNVDPLVSGTWAWSSTNADVLTATYVVTGSNCLAAGVVNPWTPWANSGAGTNTFGSQGVAFGTRFSGCTVNATYSATKNSTGEHVSATAVVQFRTVSSTGNQGTEIGDIPPEEGGATECVSLQHDLRVGSRDRYTDGEVSILQAFLQSNDSSVGLPYLSSAPTGYFGPMTKFAVKQFQRDSGLPSTGLVRELTRGEIEALTCGNSEDGSTSDASVSGSVSGSTVNVTWANLPGSVYIHLIESNNQELFVERLYTLASEYSGSHAIPSVPSGRYFLRVTRNGQRNGPLIAESPRFEVGGSGTQTCNAQFQQDELQKCATGAFAARFGQNCDWELCPYGGGSGNAALGPVITVNGVGGTGNPPDINIASGAKATVSWSVAPAGTTCTTSDGATTDRNVPLSFTGDIGPYTSTKTFSMTCTNRYGQASKTLRINVGTAATDTTTNAVAPTITSFTAATTNLPGGGSTNLSWSVTPADSDCSISANKGTAATVPANNENYQTGALSADTNFDLTCRPKGNTTATTPATGLASKSVSIKVVSASLTVNGVHSLTAKVGDTANYAWESKNADSFDSSFTSDRCLNGSWKQFGGNSAKGTSSGQFVSQQVNCTYTITYTVRNSSTGISSSDSVTEKINEAPIPASDSGAGN